MMGAAVPRVEMFAGMVDVVRGFPLAGDVRGKVLEHLYWVLGSTLPADPRAVVLHAARHVLPDAAGTALVDGVAAAAREVLARVAKWGRRDPDDRTVVIVKALKS